MNDLKFSIRQLFKNPTGTIIILVTLALVIGAMCLAMAVIQHQRTSWMPFPEPDEVVRLWEFHRDGTRERFPKEVYIEAKDRIEGFESVGVLGFEKSQVLTGEGEPRSLTIQKVSASVFTIAGIQPEIGRVFTEDEVRAGATGLLVISHDLWQRIFDGSESVLGKVVVLSELPHTIIGVMPDGFDHNELFYGLSGWIPGDFGSPGSEAEWVQIVGRRHSGVSAKQLGAELQALLPAIMESVAPDVWEASEVKVSALRLDRRPGLEVGAEYVFGIAIPLFVIGIAGFNIANVLLSRMLARRQEFAVRFSLGANRRRLIRQILCESILLALCGAALGAGIAKGIGNWMGTRGVPAQFNADVLWLTAAVAVVFGLAIGWLPALRATRGDLATDLKDSGNASSGGGVARHRLRNFLVAGQIAMATALCIGAGLLVRSYALRQGYVPEFDPNHLLRVSTTLNRDVYPEPTSRILYAEQVSERLSALPGVEEVSISSDRMIERYPFPIGFRLEGQENWRQGQMVGLTLISPNHLEMVNTPVMLGRPLLESDRRGTPPVILVNQSFVDRYFPDENPLGRRIRVGLEGNENWPAIVGVVADRRNLGNIGELGPQAYLCAQQFAPKWSSWNFLVKTGPNPSALAESIREAVRAVDENVPVYQPVTLISAIERGVQRNRGGTLAISTIGLFGLIMAVLGVYGAISNSVVERTHELGVRMALGASRGDILRKLLGQGMRYTFVGLSIGVVIGAGITFGMQEMLYGIGPFDLVTYLSVCALLLLTSLIATYLPARRATSIDPMNALRYE